ncbi:MAG: deoxynucleoside kinase [Clostridia bacterium]|nr:deoxynucleoside kinase [Clostridia bacterium]
MCKKNRKLIVIEGLDGSGKSTQIELLKARLEKENVKLRQIKLPDYDDPSSTLVKMYLGGEFGSSPSDIGAYASSLFYTVDRFASFTRHWGDDYNNAVTILADRYTTSNAVHQMVKLPKERWDEYLFWLEDLEYSKVGIPKPSFVIYLDMPIDVSQRLMSQRYNGDEVKKDIHERDCSYLYACREAAIYAAGKLGWHVVSCSDGNEPYSPEFISDRIYNLIKDETEEE